MNAKEQLHKNITLLMAKKHPWYIAIDTTNAESDSTQMAQIIELVQNGLLSHTSATNYLLGQMVVPERSDAANMLLGQVVVEPGPMGSTGGAILHGSTSCYSVEMITANVPNRNGDVFSAEALRELVNDVDVRAVLETTKMTDEEIRRLLSLPHGPDNL